ncbi:MAG TPA: branched-chain amino acid transaminase [Conexivisphaerales archaeon]|nr:branched-chain amino acid transaminase [Conexivisphaerales archaeon]
MPYVKGDYVWMDGSMVPWENATVHVMSHALHYGTAAFEGIRAYPSGEQMYVFRLSDHLRRLLNSCKIFGFDLKYGVDELSRATVETVRKNNLHGKCYIRPLVYVGFGGIGINFTGFPIQTAILAFPYERYFKKDGVSAMVSTWRRTSDQTGSPLAKISGQYTNSVLGKMEAVKHGFDECIMLDLSGKVSEGSGENLFLVEGGKLVTPSLSSSILGGITRLSVMEMAAGMGITTVERDVSRSELYVADEVFYSGTAAEITPVVSVDGRSVGNGQVGPLTSKVRSAFQKAVAGEDPRYVSWVTPVY